MDMSIKLNASYPAGTTQAPSASVTQVKPAPENDSASAEAATCGVGKSCNRYS